jgi:hypothetical protein
MKLSVFKRLGARVLTMLLGNQILGMKKNTKTTMTSLLRSSNAMPTLERKSS